MSDPIQFLCGIDNPARLREVAKAVKVKIISEREAAFVDGSTRTQFTVEVDGVRGFLVPVSVAAQQRQANAGRYLKPYNWVTL